MGHPKGWPRNTGNGREAWLRSAPPAPGSASSPASSGRRCLPASTLRSSTSTCFGFKVEASGGNKDAVKVMETAAKGQPGSGHHALGQRHDQRSSDLAVGLRSHWRGGLLLLGLRYHHAQREIIPQAYFSRNALQMTSRFAAVSELLPCPAVSADETDRDAARRLARTGRPGLFQRAGYPLIVPAPQRKR